MKVVTNIITMDLQYLLNSEGKRTAVVIDIVRWENLTLKFQDLKKLEIPKKNLPILEGVFQIKQLNFYTNIPSKLVQN